MRKLFLFILLTVSISAIKCYSQEGDSAATTSIIYESDWRFVALNNGIFYWCKVSTIKKVYGSEYNFWLKTTYSKDALAKERKMYFDELKNNDYSQFSYTLHKKGIRCDKEQTKTISIVDYDTNGAVIFSGDLNSYYEDVIPESVGETIYNWICGYINSKK